MPLVGAHPDDKEATLVASCTNALPVIGRGGRIAGDRRGAPLRLTGAGVAVGACALCCRGWRPRLASGWLPCVIAASACAGAWSAPGLALVVTASGLAGGSGAGGLL